MSSKRREYHVDRRAKKAALFFLARDANPDTRLNIPDSMRIKGYSISEAADRSLQQQVRREADKIQGEAVPGPSAPAAAASASALITMSNTANVGRPALRTITVPAAVSVLPAAGVAALPSPPRKTQKTSHQEQIERQNERKQKAVHAQAHARATTLVAEERAKEKENRRTTAEVIAQVEGEFRARGFPVMMSKPTINRYVALNMIGTFPLARGYEGAMPHAAFELLMIAAESFIQIKGVNKDHIERNTLMIMFNELCGVTSSMGRVKENMFERVMRATNVSLNASISHVVEDRRVRWTMYSNLHAWFVSFKAFLIEFGFATIGSDGRLLIMEATMRRIVNVDETEVSLDGSKTNAGGRPAVSFHDPHFPLTQRPAAKSSLSCTGIFGSNAAGGGVPIHWQLPTAATSEDREKLRFDFLRHVSSTRTPV
jgi:hypothetical protein